MSGAGLHSGLHMAPHIIAVGRMRPGPERDLLNRYAARLPQTPIVREVPARGAAREAAALLDALPNGTVAVALDEGGTQLDSAGLARRLAAARDTGARRIAFLIGGADGLAPDVLARADWTLSLGRVTWPHMLARALLMEQLCRAHSILSGHPYHRQ